MSKRRITQQQSQRIQKNQTSIQTAHDTTSDNLQEKGLVISRFGRRALIETHQGQMIPCAIRANISDVVAGDHVIFRKEGVAQGMIISCLPRHTLLGRPHKQGTTKPIAANISQLVIVVAPKPEISWPLLDSYLIMAESLHLNALIVLNKEDIAPSHMTQILLQDYQSLNYPVVFSSCMKKQGLQSLEQTLAHEVNVLVGQSGVGKSSIIKTLLPQAADIKTQEISALCDLGKHTTSYSTYYHLPQGGAIIDSPGVREFKLWHMSIPDITWGYREFRNYLSQCQYRNCNHINDKGCSLIKAAHQGLISHNRYQNYVTLVAQYTK